MKKLFVLVLCLAAVAGMAFAEGAGEYPERDITNVLVWGAGGGTDQCNRAVMAEMGEYLGFNINVVNNPGGIAGSAGMSAAWAKPADGYTIVGLSESCATSAVMGGFPERMNVWDYFIIGKSPDVLSVTPDAPYNTIEELVEAAKANPGSIRAGAGGAGSIHHLNLLAFQDGADVEFNFIPYPGSAPTQNAAMTGEITVVITSAAEQSQLIRGGKLKPLAMMIPDDFDLDGTVIPSAFPAYPGLAEYLPIEQAIGFAIKKEADKVVKAKLAEAFDVAMESDAVKKWLKDNYYLAIGTSGAEANAAYDKLESMFSWKLQDLGAAKVDPAVLGIPRP